MFSLRFLILFEIHCLITNHVSSWKHTERRISLRCPLHKWLRFCFRVCSTQNGSYRVNRVSDIDTSRHEVWEPPIADGSHNRGWSWQWTRENTRSEIETRSREDCCPNSDRPQWDQMLRIYNASKKLYVRCENMEHCVGLFANQMYHSPNQTMNSDKLLIN